MNKIMFNDRFNLTKLILEGIKTHTRRLELDCNIRFYIYNYEGSYPKIEDNKICIYSDDGYLLATRNTRYKIGEEVAIAQSYSQCGNFPDYELDEDGYPVMPKRSGYFNKMFVKAELMPYRIRITNIKIERMQDISDEDCLKEGITEVSGEFEAHTVLQNGYYGERLRVIKRYYGIQYYELGESPREAYGTLIDKISGKGTWESNPYVIVYEFELIK